MIRLFVEWLSFSSVEWLYISFCAFGLGMLVGVGICAYRQIKTSLEGETNEAR